MQKLNLDEFFAKFDKSVYEKLRAKLDDKNVDGLILFECVDMCSSNLGARTACVFGKEFTFKDENSASKSWLGDLPSQRKYPVAYYKKEVGNGKCN